MDLEPHDEKEPGADAIAMYPPLPVRDGDGKLPKWGAQGGGTGAMNAAAQSPNY